jgi:NADH dehydrogenase
MSTIAVTGAAGFLGRRVLEQLKARDEQVVAIDRVAMPAHAEDGTRWVEADLSEPALYEPALAGASCVLHLAAITGKARPGAYRRVNVEGTETLLGAAKRAGVSRFVLVSSIAVAFKDRRHYPYADSKAAAEALVRESGLAWTIVRPTMLMGPGSPIQAALGKLARLPASPMFGSGERLVEPVDVADAARLLAALARTPEAAGETLELGGPERISLNALYARLRALEGAKGPPKLVHLPVGPIRALLALLEGPLLPVLPLTAGQLASFVNDSVAAPHPLVERLAPDRAPSPPPVTAAETVRA